MSWQVCNAASMVFNFTPMPLPNAFRPAVVNKSGWGFMDVHVMKDFFLKAGW